MSTQLDSRTRRRRSGSRRRNQLRKSLLTQLAARLRSRERVGIIKCNRIDNKKLWPQRKQILTFLTTDLCSGSRPIILATNTLGFMQTNKTGKPQQNISINKHTYVRTLLVSHLINFLPTLYGFCGIFNPRLKALQKILTKDEPQY